MAGEGESYPDLMKLRTEYRRHSLSETDVDPDPIRQFVAWMNQAISAGVLEPNAMVLATSTRDGVPSARVVLLKHVDAGGFGFYTNYTSRKARELDANPRAALAIYWPELERQVRAEGTVERTTDAESDHYFASRPREAQIGSAASPQSQPIPSRQWLEARCEKVGRRYPDPTIPRPSHWGGYRLRPQRVEFWQGRESRLHDRIEYALDETGIWLIRRLAP